jgi:beta-galactosidase
MTLWGTSICLAVLIGGGKADGTSVELEAQVRQTTAGPALFVNGQRMEPTVLFVNLHDIADEASTAIQLGEVASAGRRGVNIVSFTIGMPWPREGEEPDFRARVDHWVDAVLEANPQALLLPRFGTTSPPDWWVAEHPDDIMLYDDGSRRLASVHSLAWREAAARQVSALVAHLERKYGDHVLGYHPCGQHTGEWFYEKMWEGRLTSLEPVAETAFRRFLSEKYETDAALRSAWHDREVTRETAAPPSLRERTGTAVGPFRDPEVERPAIDFAEFQNREMADTVEVICRAVKRVAPRKLTIAFYGYHFELAAAPRGLASGGHLALGRLLDSPHVDVLCSPVSYFDRGSGGGGYFMAPVDSVQLRGKLWLIEDDTRTHLSPPDSGYGRTNDSRETQGVLTRNFAHVVTRGSAVWWMDLLGQGWYVGDEMWDHLGGLRDVYRASMTQFNRYHPEIAVIVDERSHFYAGPSPAPANPVLYRFRKEWYRIGAPVGIYLLEDLVAGRVPPARMYLLLDTWRLDQDQIDAVRMHACRPGNVVVWMYAPGLVRDGQKASKHVREVTGIGLDEIASGNGNIVLVSGDNPFSAEHGPLSPAFAVVDDQARAIARYADSSGVAIAAKQVDGYTSVYSGVLQIPAGVLRELANDAGVHIYSEDGDVVTVQSLHVDRVRFEFGMEDDLRLGHQAFGPRCVLLRFHSASGDQPDRTGIRRRHGCRQRSS